MLHQRLCKRFKINHCPGPPQEPHAMDWSLPPRRPKGRGKATPTGMLRDPGGKGAHPILYL